MRTSEHLRAFRELKSMARLRGFFVIDRADGTYTLERDHQHVTEGNYRVLRDYMVAQPALRMSM